MTGMRIIQLLTMSKQFIRGMKGMDLLVFLKLKDISSFRVVTGFIFHGDMDSVATLPLVQALNKQKKRRWQVEVARNNTAPL